MLDFGFGANFARIANIIYPASPTDIHATAAAAPIRYYENLFRNSMIPNVYCAKYNCRCIEYYDSRRHYMTPIRKLQRHANGTRKSRIHAYFRHTSCGGVK